jgi:dethiobiotin synthetase
LGNGYFVSGIGTDVGKTIISTMLSIYFDAYYWKPIQTGVDLDAEFVNKYIAKDKIIDTQINLKLPAAPYIAALEEKKIILLEEINIPETSPIIIEGAGGILVPINEQHSILDLIIKFNLPLILVASNYLGYINHTLLTLEFLKEKGIKIAALVINNAKYDVTEDYIQSKYNSLCIIKINNINSLTLENIEKEAQKFSALV